MHERVKKAPRPEDLPRIYLDAQSDMIVSVFTGGLFRDDLVHVVRGWMEENSRVSPAQVKSFKRVFPGTGPFLSRRGPQAPQRSL